MSLSKIYGIFMRKNLLIKKYILAVLLFSLCSPLYAGDRLVATGGISQIEGVGGGGLTPWALITGYGTDQQIGASAFYTKAKTNGGFTLDTGGVAVGFCNRFEMSLSQTKFGLSNTAPHESIRVNTLGLKVRLLGDAIYDQDRWYPQIAAGMMIKHNEDFGVPKALGAKKATGVDFYLSATKLYLDAVYGRNLLLGASVIATKANQFGILGFGGDDHDNYRLEPSFSAAIMLTDNLLVGAEYRYKPDNLSVFEEDNAQDLFITWFPIKNLSVTAAYVDLGNIANKDNQEAWYFSGQVSY
jgi:hypothetical protein